MASINSIPNAQGSLGSSAFRSMTSLKSADDVLLPSKPSSTSESDAKENTGTAESSSEKLIEFSPAKQKDTKLVDISPSEEVKQTVNGVTESESNTDETITNKRR